MIFLDNSGKGEYSVNVTAVRLIAEKRVGAKS